MKHTLLKFLADTMDYGEVIHGVEKLNNDQLVVIFEKLKAQLAEKQHIKNRDCRQAEKACVEKNGLSENGSKPKAEISCCPHCGSLSFNRHGKTTGGVQRYLCKDCGKTFSENYGLITHYTHLQEWQWLEAVRGTINGESLTNIAKNMNVSTATAWLCRIKLYKMIQDIYGYCDTFNSITEADGTYVRLSFKGKRDRNWFIDTLGRLPRHHRTKAERIDYIGKDFNRLAKAKPHCLREMIMGSQKKLTGCDMIDRNHQQVCILTAVDRSNHIYVQPVSAGSADSSDVKKYLQGRLKGEAVLVTDGHHSYKYLCHTNNIRHVEIPSKQHFSGTFNLGRVNSLHSSLKRFLGKHADRPATKYLDLYLMMFWWLEKQKEQSKNELMQRLFHIATGYVDNATRVKMKRITYRGITGRELPIDTKGFF